MNLKIQMRKTMIFKPMMRIMMVKKIIYDKAEVIVATDQVYDKVATLNRVSILSFWGVVYCDDRARMGRLVESLFWDDIKYNRKSEINKMKLPKMKLNDSPTEEELYPNNLSIETLASFKLDKLNTIFEATNIVAKMEENCPD